MFNFEPLVQLVQLCFRGVQALGSTVARIFRGSGEEKARGRYEVGFGAMNNVIDCLSCPTADRLTLFPCWSMFTHGPKS